MMLEEISMEKGTKQQMKVKIKLTGRVTGD